MTRSLIHFYFPFLTFFSTIPPGSNPVLNITPIVDSTNVTLEWPRPEGRIETYVIRWWPVDNREDVRTKNVTESNDVAAGGLYEENSVQRVLVGDLMPGVQYSFVICTISYNLVSEITNLTTRTSEYTILFNPKVYRERVHLSFD